MQHIAGLESESFEVRLRAAVSLAWRLFAKKVGAGAIQVHKEASMQLQYAHVLQQLLPLVCFDANESFKLELENGVELDGRRFEIDLLLIGLAADHRPYRIAVEMKCYRTKAASGKPRGAQDIFRKDVYEDLQITERYVSAGRADEGVVLVMNEHEHFVSPRPPRGEVPKSWIYDLTHGATFGPKTLDTPIGGQPVRIELERRYALDWERQGDFWFLEVQGVLPQISAASTCAIAARNE